VFAEVYDSSPLQVAVAVHLQPLCALHIVSVINVEQSAEFVYIINGIEIIHVRKYLFIYFYKDFI
jgi:hypothetical protein